MRQPVPLPKTLAKNLHRIESKIVGEPKEHLYVLDLSGNVVAHFLGDERKVKPSKEITKLMRSHPMSFVTTHNHPRRSPPSGSDVHNALRRMVFESRVVAGDQVHRMQPIERRKEKPSRLYECAARIETRRERGTQSDRQARTMELYAKGSRALRLPALIRYGVDPLVRSNPTGAVCGCCDEATLHLRG